MQVIFTRDLAGQGLRGQVKNVSEGYAQNFLFKKGYAKPVTEKLIKEIELDEKNKITKLTKTKKLHEKSIQELTGKQIKVYAKAGEGGQLFGSVHEKDIILALDTKFKIDSQALKIHFSKTIKHTGEFNIEVSYPHTEKTNLRLTVLPS